MRMRVHALVWTCVYMCMCIEFFLCSFITPHPDKGEDDLGQLGD